MAALENLYYLNRFPRWKYNGHTLAIVLYNDASSTETMIEIFSKRNLDFRPLQFVFRPCILVSLDTDSG